MGRKHGGDIGVYGDIGTCCILTNQLHWECDGLVVPERPVAKFLLRFSQP